jgi:pyruvate/2-oxoglutarate dehydrogenase complex dihydrolipoamide acyltransferase (E2) component
MAKVEVVMPQMGESVMEGTVIEWAKKVGDKVEVDETLLEIATDKVDTEVPSPEAGVLVEILVEADETVEVGQPIAIIDTEGDASSASSGGSGSEEKPKAQADEKAEEPAEPAAEAAGSGADADGERIEVVMPQMGESVMEGEVIEWLKSVGDTVEVDEPLLEIATDKVDTEVPSPEGGTLVEILVEAGDTVEVGQPIAIVATGKAASGSAPAPKKDTPKSEAKKAEPAQKEEQPAATEGSEPQRVGSDGRFFSPLVRSIAKEEGISQEELESITGSGKDNRVTKDDVMKYLDDRKAGKVKPAAKSSGLSKPSSGESGRISAGELNIVASR